MDSPEETARLEIEEAVFSRQELGDFSLDLNTRFFKPAALSARLTTMAGLNIHQLKFRQADGLNYNTVEVVGLFDRNGNFVQGIRKPVALRLSNQTLEKPGNMTVRTTLDTKPASYVLRLVVRDTRRPANGGGQPAGGDTKLTAIFMPRFP